MTQAPDFNLTIHYMTEIDLCMADSRELSVDKRRARSQTFSTVWAHRPTAQKPGGKCSSDNKKEACYHDKRCGCRLQSNMSHKQKSDCTAGQRALCDHRTHTAAPPLHCELVATRLRLYIQHCLTDELQRQKRYGSSILR